MKETLLKILRDYKNFLGIRKFYYGIFVAVLYSSFTMLEPFLFTQIIKLIENFYTTKIFALDTLLFYLGLWFVFIIVQLLLAFYYRYFIVDKGSLNFYKQNYISYGSKILNMSFNTYLQKKQGEIFKKFDKGIEVLFWLPFFIYREILGVFTGVIFALTILVFINFKMFLIMSSMIPAILLLSYIFNYLTWKKQRALEEEYSKVSGYLVDATTNFSLIKTLSLDKYFSGRIKKDIEEIIEKQLHVSKRWSISDIYTGIIVTIVRLLVLGVGSYMLFLGEITLAELFLYFTFIGFIYFPLGAVFSRLREVQKNISSLKIFYDEFDNLDTDEGNGKPLKEVKGKIEFKDVSFSYKQENEIIKDINFTIAPGEKIALVGDTGAGKSTIVSLLFRLWEVGKGTISIDNQDIAKVSKKSLRENLGIVMQDNTLFNTSIKKNLLLAKPNAKETEIEEALKKAHANFVFKLEKGIDTEIGERGLKLSGGEKQRLNIARLFLKNPKIIILDEATSALDNKTEKEIQKSFEELMTGRTSIIIAHRLSTIKHVDRIFVLENGKIVETGNYDELIELGGRFTSLANPEKLSF